MRLTRAAKGCFALLVAPRLISPSLSSCGWIQNTPLVLGTAARPRDENRRETSHEIQCKTAWLRSCCMAEAITRASKKALPSQTLTSHEVKSVRWLTLQHGSAKYRQRHQSSRSSRIRSRGLALQRINLCEYTSGTCLFGSCPPAGRQVLGVHLLPPGPLTSPPGKNRGKSGVYESRGYCVPGHLKSRPVDGANFSSKVTLRQKKSEKAFALTPGAGRSRRRVCARSL